MSLQKLKFKEVVNDNQTKYFINDKEVEENVYKKLYEDESLFTLPPLPKIDHSPEDNIDSDKQEYVCEDCQELLDIIQDIREMDDEKAVNSLREYLEIIETQEQMQTLIEVYSQFGDSMNKVAARIENQLEDFMEQFEDNEELD